MPITSGNNTITVTTRNRVRVFNKPTTSVSRKNGLVTLYEKSYNGGLTKKYDWDLETSISDGYATLDLLLDYLTQQLDDTGGGSSTITGAQVIAALGYTPYSDTNPTGFITASSLTGLATEVYVNSQGFLVASDLTPYLTIASASTTYYPLSGNPSNYITASALSPYLTSATAASTYQPILVSGTNIKTINGATLLGSGDIVISGGSSVTAGTGITDNGGIFSANLATGISGGQSVIGGTASGNNLTLSSTTHATKGKLLFGSSAFDEVNNRLGIGLTTPTARLHLPSGTTTVSPLKLTTGTNLTTEEVGALEFASNNLYFTPRLGTHSKREGFVTADQNLFNVVSRSLGAGDALTNASQYSIYLGTQAGQGTAGGSNIIALGFNALSFSNGAGCIGIGQETGRNYGVTGINNILIGNFAGHNILAGTHNIGIGQRALASVFGSPVSGSNNIGIGFQVGDNITSGSGNVAIGNNIDFPSQTTSGQLTIQNIIFGVGNTATATTVSSGNIGIGLTTPTARLHLVAGTAAAGTAPLKLTSGTNLTTPENGSFEFDGTNLFFTVGGVRKTVSLI